MLLTASCMKPSAESHQQTIIDSYDFLRDFPALTNEGLVNIVVEIPAGCNQKWEVNKQTGHLEWEMIGGDSLRVVKYLPYLANYGMIPGTWLPVSQGGDNDPLDVFLLGERAARGSVISARIIGVIKMQDKGQQDDKLIAVTGQDWFAEVHDLNDLEELYPGIIDIFKAWLTNYKGKQGIVEIQSIEDYSYANNLLNHAIKSFQTTEGIIH